MNEIRLRDPMDAAALKAHADALNASAKAQEHMATTLEELPGKVAPIVDKGIGGGGLLLIAWFTFKLLLLWLGGKK